MPSPDAAARVSAVSRALAADPTLLQKVEALIASHQRQDASSGEIVGTTFEFGARLSAHAARLGGELKNAQVDGLAGVARKLHEFSQSIAADISQPALVPALSPIVTEAVKAALSADLRNRISSGLHHGSQYGPSTRDLANSYGQLVQLLGALRSVPGLHQQVSEDRQLLAIAADKVSTVERFEGGHLYAKYLQGMFGITDQKLAQGRTEAFATDFRDGKVRHVTLNSIPEALRQGVVTKIEQSLFGNQRQTEADLVTFTKLCTGCRELGLKHGEIPAKFAQAVLDEFERSGKYLGPVMSALDANLPGLPAREEFVKSYLRRIAVALACKNPFDEALSLGKYEALVNAVVAVRDLMKLDPSFNGPAVNTVAGNIATLVRSGDRADEVRIVLTEAQKVPALAETTELREAWQAFRAAK